MIFEFGEIFCGPGGIALGARLAEIKVNGKTYKVNHKWATDYDKDTCETYRQNFCLNSPKSVICKDIRKLNLNKLGAIDALAFGFPCNDFSIVGKQKGINGVYGPLYSKVSRC